MTLTKEQIAEAKAQLSEQIQHLPPEQKAEAQKQIDSMSAGAIESMIKQQQSQTKVFRLIVEGKIPSTKIDENKSAIAVLSVKAISEGHTLIIPKSPANGEKNIPKDAYALSEEISKKIISNLSPKSIEIFPETAFGETILNVIPIYDEPLSLQSPRTDKTPEDLEKTKKKLLTIKLKKEKIVIKKPRAKKKKILKLDKRIP